MNTALKREIYKINVTHATQQSSPYHLEQRSLFKGRADSQMSVSIPHFSFHGSVFTLALCCLPQSLLCMTVNTGNLVNFHLSSC